MDCNKDEASRAMLIAEQKLKDNDIAAAKRFACKAKSMCHDLEGIEQLICTIDVLVSAETKDSYEILSLDRSADLIALKKRYRKLVLQLHPDKNKSCGADAAFKAVHKAYRALSENNNTELKGHSTSTGESQQNSSKATTSNPAPSSEGGEPHGFGANNAASEPGKKQEMGAATNAASDPPTASSAGVKKSTSAATPSPTVGRKKQKSGSSGDTPVYRYANVHRTFWTLCDKCNIQFKHPAVYRNHTIECRVCRHHYQATEIPAPTMD